MVKPFFEMFLNDLGHAWQAGEDECTGTVEVVDELCLPGTTTLRAGVLASIADIVSGALSNRAIAPRIPLTVDLTVHTLRPTTGATVAMTARNLKVGRSMIVSETWFEDDGGPVAVSHSTFMASPRPEDVMERVFWGRAPAPHNLTAPILDQIGARRVSPGVVELDRVPYVMQPSGTIQGGAIALVAELAAESLVDAPIADLEIRYLSTVRVGPARASATLLGDGLIRVEVRDAGNDDRLATLVMARPATSA